MMAMFDDRRFLLSHINHSFITGDDTGICEMVMLDEDVFKNQHKQCLKLKGQDQAKSEDILQPEAYDLKYESELFDSEQGQSYDIADDIDYICHRRRSNTAQRLDRLKKEKINQSRTKTIVWRCSSLTNSQCEDKLSENEAEANCAIEVKKLKSPPTKSGLTRLLEKFPSLPKNPFDEFAQFDGGMSETVPVLKIMIFIAINNNITCNNNQLQHQQQLQVHQKQQQSQENNTKPNNGPLEVVIVSTAKVQDLIGLICWQYTNEGREPKLHHDINKYCLRIAEDNGEVDPDFASLNPKEPLSKFNFPSLALTEKTEEPIRSYNHPYQPPNDDIYNRRVPTIAPNVITTSTKISNPSSRFAILTRIIFKDAKLDAN